MDSVRVIGDRLQFLRSSGPGASSGVTDPVADLSLFDRQARAFGPELQPVLKALTVGVVGAGGTGSSVVEQLIRLGVGTLRVIDEQSFDKTNVNRVYGSRLTDQGTPKVALVRRLADEIGLSTKIVTIEGSVVRPKIFRALLDCDVVFGCTDGQLSRSILERLPTWYYIPVIDMGVRIDPKEGAVRSIQGRVTVLSPGSPCLSCRGRISAERIRAESIAATNPEEADALRKEGYLDELEETAPSVIPFTTTVAATAVTELLQRLTGFMGAGRRSSEVIHLFDAQRVRTNNPPSRQGCICDSRGKWGRGDRPLMMGITWCDD